MTPAHGEGMDILAIIPARGGSKGIPGKNLVSLGGKPLIQWTIDAALKSRYLSRIIVTSDSPVILSFAWRCGVEGHKRPGHLGRDSTAIRLVEDDVLAGKPHPVAVRLQPTSPLRTFYDIDAALEPIVNGEARAVVSCCRVREHPYLVKSQSWQDIIRGADEKRLAPRQEYHDYYWINGAIYAARREWYGHWYDADVVTPYVMPRERSIDIDDHTDLKIAEALLGRV